MDQQLISKSKIVPLKQDTQEQGFDILPISHTKNMNFQQFKILNKSPAKGIFNLQGLKKDETIEHLQEQLKESKKSKSELHEKYVNLEISYQKLHDENTNLVQKIQEYEKEREELLLQLKDLQESNTQRDPNIYKLEALSAENCELQYKMNQQEQEIEDLQEICQIKDIQIGVIKTDLKIAQDTIKQLRQVIDTKDSQFKKCMTKMKQQQLILQSQITQCSTDNLNISKQVYDQMGERIQLINQLNDSNNSNELHRTTAEQYKSNFEELKSKFNEFKIINQEKMEILQSNNEKLQAQINKAHS